MIVNHISYNILFKHVLNGSFKGVCMFGVSVGMIEGWLFGVLSI